MCVSNYTIIWLNKKLTLINRVIEYNKVNDPYCEIKYLNILSPPNFFKYVFSYY